MDIFVDVVREQRALLLNAALRAAHELGVVELLLECSAVESKTAASVATALGVNERRLTPLLDVLAAEGVLHRETQGSNRLYRAAYVPAYERQSCGDWDRLARVIRTDTHLPERAETLESYLSYVDARSSVVAPIVWRSVAPAPERLLDLGGGLGAYSRAFLEIDPGNTSAVIDVPPVVDVALAIVSQTDPRLEWIAGDVREVVLERCYDVALLANVLHLYGDRCCRDLLRRAAAALRPGGLLVIKDLYLMPDCSGPLTGLYFALNMAVYTESGGVHQVADLERWLAGVGLGDVRVVKLSELPDSVVVTARHP
jgi:SAM-dependent methyltransferase